MKFKTKSKTFKERWFQSQKKNRMHLFIYFEIQMYRTAQCVLKKTHRCLLCVGTNMSRDIPHLT